MKESSKSKHKFELITLELRLSIFVSPNNLKLLGSTEIVGKYR